MITKKTSKASLLLKLIGDKLPDEVYQHMSAEDLEKLSALLGNSNLPDITEQNRFLSWFNSSLGHQKRISHPARYEENDEPLNLLEELLTKNRNDLTRLIHGESPRVIALVLFFGNPAEVSAIIAELPDKLLGNVLAEIQKIDHHSETDRNELERFLGFKNYLLKNRISTAKVNNRQGKMMAEILSGLNPHTSQNLFAKIKENSPHFAENIEEHYYSFQDILKMNRSTLSEFLSGFHPIVLACALKGIETSAREKILTALEPWLTRMIVLESDSMGPVSLAEIEESQKGILEALASSIESGGIRLWKGGLHGKTGI